MARKIYHGTYSRKEYKDWGKEGGRPRKFANVAEKLRFYRQQKKLATVGKPLRGYKKFTSRIKVSTGLLSGWTGGEKGKGRQIAVDFIKCPECGIYMSQKGALITKLNEYGQLIEYCGKCGYEPTKRKIIHRAGTNVERQKKYKSNLEKDDDEDEEE